MSSFSVQGPGNWNLFGIQFAKQQPKVTANTQQQPNQVNQASFALPQNDDGAVILQTGGYFGSYVDLEGVVRNEVELITRYREMAMQPELETAIDHLVNEAIVVEDDGHSVDLVVDNLKQPPEIKKRLLEEFHLVLKLLDFGKSGHDIFRRWYIDGRMFYHAITDNTDLKAGIKELRYIDPRRIRKVREIQKTKDPKTGIDIVTNVQEYYLYNERGVIGAHSNLGSRIAPDSVINVNSGLMDSRRAMVLSYLHKCLTGDSRIKTPDGWKYIKDLNIGEDIFSYDVKTQKLVETKVTNKWNNGKKIVVDVILDSQKLRCTPDHKFLVKNIETNEVSYVNARDLDKDLHKAFYFYNGNINPRNITDVIYNSTQEEVYDIEVANDNHNFIANGIVVHNCIKPLNMLRMVEDATVVYILCLNGETRIKTGDGWKYIKNVTEGETVWSSDGHLLIPTKVKKQWKTGKRQTYVVRSKHHEIIGTDNHPILVFDNSTNTVEYVRIDKLVPNKHNFVYVKPKNETKEIEFPEVRGEAIYLEKPSEYSEAKFPGKEKLIRDCAKDLNFSKHKIRNFLYGLQKLPKDIAYGVIERLPIDVTLGVATEGKVQNELNLPKYIDEDFARLFGFMIGDGSISRYTLSFAEGVDEDQNKYYASLLEDYFGVCKRYPCRGRKYTGYTTSNTLASELYKKLGFLSGPRNKRIPKWVFEAKDSIKRAFIEGLADADGHNRALTYGGFASTIALCNKQLVEDIKEIWTSLGLSSGHIRHNIKEETFRIIGDEKEPRLMPRTENWEIHISEIPLPKFEKIQTITEGEIEDVYELEVESSKHNFVANGVLVHNSRAPARRVFYIDVGNLPKIKAEQYVQNIMNQYRNKMVYDACLSMDTKIPLLDGRTLSLTDIQKEFETGKQLWAYSCDPVTGKFSPGLITSAGVTKFNQPVMKLTLDNGKTITCTYDHKFPVWNKGKVEAKDLVVGDSMIPKNQEKYKDHKITKIEYLEELIDVGTLGIDKHEIYHDNHTFALDAGIYTCNSTGEVRDDRKFMSMLEDFWMPRREGNRSTEIQTLQGDASLAHTENVDYFKRKLYESLSVPISRLIPQEGFSLGRSAEVTRDEMNFTKFVSRLRNKFSVLFNEIMRIQCVLKNICSEEDWNQFKEEVWYSFLKDNNFDELKEAELWKERLSLLGILDPFVGAYFSRKWVRTNVLKMTEEEIEEMDTEIGEEEAEGKSGPVAPEMNPEDQPQDENSPLGNLDDKVADVNGEPRPDDPDNRFSQLKFGEDVSKNTNRKTKETLNIITKVIKEHTNRRNENANQ